MPNRKIYVEIRDYLNKKLPKIWLKTMAEYYISRFMIEGINLSILPKNKCQMRDSNIDEFESRLSQTLNIKVKAIFVEFPTPRIQLTFPFSYQGKVSKLIFNLNSADALPIILDDVKYKKFSDYIIKQIASATSISKSAFETDLNTDLLPF